MIEAIKEIGGKILKEDETKVLDNLTRDLPFEKKGEKQHLVILNIFKKRIEIDFEEVKDETSQKYLWIGKEAGNNPQIYFTTDNLGYLISQTIPNLVKKTSEGSKLGSLLRRVKKEIFYDLGLSGRYRYILDIGKIGFVEKEYMNKLIKKAKRETKKQKEIFKSILKDAEAKVIEYIKSKTGGLTQKDIGLYTLKINNRLMTDYKEYRELIVNEKIDSLFGKQKKLCSSCNEDKPVTDNPEFAKAKSALGYYTTDKVGFSSDLSGKFTKNFIVCKDCYTKLLVGEVFIRNNLLSYIGGLSLYIVPKFIFPAEFSSTQLDKWAKYIQSSFNSAKSLDGLKAFEEKLDEYREFEGSKNNLK